MTNYVWLISQSVVNDYDTYDSAVVIAPTLEAAKRIHPSEYCKGWEEAYGQWYGERPDGERYPFDKQCSSWSKPNEVDAICVGTANPDQSAGTVICASFNAG